MFYITSLFISSVSIFLPMNARQSELLTVPLNAIKGAQTFQTIWEPTESYRYQMSAMKQVPYSELTNIRQHHTKFS